MREWLIMKLTALIQMIASSRKATAPKVVEEVPYCPICGMEWDGNEIFCFNCGYEMRDQELPLFSPLERTGKLTDPEGLVEQESANRLREELASFAASSGLDVSILILPERLSKCLRSEDSNRETLDGFAYNVYNTWQMGKGSGLKGLLLVIDPGSGERALVKGKNGPDITGKAFRGWYAEYAMSITETRETGVSSRLAGEIGFIMRKIIGDGTKSAAAA